MSREFEPRLVPAADEDEDKEKKDSSFHMTRRRFMGFLALGALGASSKYLVENGAEFYEQWKEKDWAKKLEAEKFSLRKRIDKGIKQSIRTDEIIREHRQVRERLETLPEGSPEWDVFKKQSRALNWEMLDMPSRKLGGLIAYNLMEANPYAEQLLQNENALNNLSVLSATYRRGAGWSDFFWFPYNHNQAPGYLELGKLPAQEVHEKLEALTEHQKKQGSSIHRLIPENSLYSLLDRKFDIELTPEKMQQELDTASPDWRKWEENFGDRNSSNKLEAFDVFELNKMQRVLEQMKNPEFAKSVFAERDNDLRERLSESGGVIPFPETSSALLSIPPKEKGYNNEYVVPGQRVAMESATIVPYHFHAVDVTSDLRGPSDGDDGNAVPNVVFSSIDKDDIAVHFYVSRYNRENDRYDRMDVMSLGLLRKPD